MSTQRIAPTGAGTPQTGNKSENPETLTTGRTIAETLPLSPSIDRVASYRKDVIAQARDAIALAKMKLTEVINLDKRMGVADYKFSNAVSDLDDIKF